MQAKKIHLYVGPNIEEIGEIQPRAEMRVIGDGEHCIQHEEKTTDVTLAIIWVHGTVYGIWKNDHRIMLYNNKEPFDRTANVIQKIQRETGAKYICVLACYVGAVVDGIKGLDLGDTEILLFGDSEHATWRRQNVRHINKLSETYQKDNPPSLKTFLLDYIIDNPSPMIGVFEGNSKNGPLIVKAEPPKNSNEIDSIKDYLASDSAITYQGGSKTHLRFARSLHQTQLKNNSLSWNKEQISKYQSGALLTAVFRGKIDSVAWLDKGGSADVATDGLTPLMMAIISYSRIGVIGTLDTIRTLLNSRAKVDGAEDDDKRRL